MEKPIVSVLLTAVLGGSPSLNAATPPVAGVEPHLRPANAPVITEFKKDSGWYGQALDGVSQPYPGSLRFLEDQGAWHTPFNRPGMTGPYDIRGWHQTPVGGTGR
jgi:hypothetical protein